MRRLSLSTKLIAAALPLVVAVGALLALTVRSDLNDVQRAENGADLGAVWNPLITALTAVETEVDQAVAVDGGAAIDPTVSAESRRTTDQAINDLRTSIDTLGASEAAGEHITASRSALSAARRNLDMVVLAPELQPDVDPIVAYQLAGRELVSVGQLLPSEAGDPALGRELLAVVKLAEAKLAADRVVTNVETWQQTPDDRTPLAAARTAFSELEATLSEFLAIAPDAWTNQYRASGFTTAIAGYRAELDTALRAAQTGDTAAFDTPGFASVVEQGVAFQTEISQSIVDRASAQVSRTRNAALLRIGVILAAVLLAAAVAWAIIRSITKRIKAVAASANVVSTEQLPALVDALRDPRSQSVLPHIEPVDASGSDELSDLARAFNSMQGTLVDVAQEQVEVLRRGVSDIFVTMARRNRSLIDRQLAMLDEFEAEVDDPDVLSNYYQLDHLATRMRRNSESLLVLANAEPKRRRVKATEIDDVVRASIGEVEEYRRIEIEALESLQVRGNVVADVSHLLAELLDNATAFSPPESPVRVGGRRTGDSYMLRIVDDGVGIGPERLREINEMLREPPIVGLSVESTLGMSVVSLLANKYDIDVTLSAGNPGLTVDVVLPSALFGPIEMPFEMPGSVAAPAPVEEHAGEQLVTWNTADEQPMFDIGAVAGATEVFLPADQIAPPAPALPVAPVAPSPAEAPLAPAAYAPGVFGDDDDSAPRVVPSDWTRMSLDLTAFKSGQQSADGGAVSDPEGDVVAEPTVEPASSALDAHPIDPGLVVARGGHEAAGDDAIDASTAEIAVSDAEQSDAQSDAPRAIPIDPGFITAAEEDDTHIRSEPAPSWTSSLQSIEDLAAQVAAEGAVLEAEMQAEADSSIETPSSEDADTDDATTNPWWTSRPNSSSNRSASRSTTSPTPVAALPSTRRRSACPTCHRRVHPTSSTASSTCPPHRRSPPRVRAGARLRRPAHDQHPSPGSTHTTIPSVCQLAAPEPAPGRTDPIDSPTCMPTTNPTPSALRSRRSTTPAADRRGRCRPGHVLPSRSRWSSSRKPPHSPDSIPKHCASGSGPSSRSSPRVPPRTPTRTIKVISEGIVDERSRQPQLARRSVRPAGRSRPASGRRLVGRAPPGRVRRRRSRSRGTSRRRRLRHDRTGLRVGRPLRRRRRVERDRRDGERLDVRHRHPRRLADVRGHDQERRHRNDRLRDRRLRRSCRRSAHTRSS